ncbi:MAG: HU family DNA-binding protein [Clostridia bacterium]|nr:HU family DNA-binding protein [Clostridia bacterium]
MTKSQWIETAAKNSGMTKKEITDAYRALSDAFYECLMQGEAMQISGFGTFEVREREAYTARNPKTGESVEMPSSRRIAFLPGKTLKEKINET